MKKSKPQKLKVASKELFEAMRTTLILLMAKKPQGPWTLTVDDIEHTLVYHAMSGTYTLHVGRSWSSDIVAAISEVTGIHTWVINGYEFKYTPPVKKFFTKKAVVVTTLVVCAAAYVYYRSQK